MILDTQCMFSDDQAITVTANSTNIIDLGNDGSEVQALNQKGELELVVQVSSADLASGTSVKASLYSSDSSTMNGEAVVIETAAIAEADLVAGYYFKLGKLPRIDAQYLRLTYTVVGTFDAGAITAGLNLDRQTNAQ